jgi:hypothetical protein
MPRTRQLTPRPALHLIAAGIALALALAGPLATAEAKRNAKKSIWGPVYTGGVFSQFPTYQRLGTTIFQMTLRWDQVAPTRPAHPTNRHDRAYTWTPEIDFAIGEAHDAGIRIALTVYGTPPWANGRQTPQFAPRKVKDLSAFLKAAAARYPTVHLWRIWDEPNRIQNFAPMTPEVPGQRFGDAQRAAPHRYARMLDTAYVTLKHASKKNLIIGGNTTTQGSISPLHWIRSLRLPDGKHARMDLYGHDPYSVRPPTLNQPEIGNGNADFADLDTLAGWVDKYIKGSKPHLRIFISRYSVPSAHAPHGQTFFVDRDTQARWLYEALKISESWPRIYAFGWSDLYDEPPSPTHDEQTDGLLDYMGAPKPAAFAYQDG